VVLEFYPHKEYLSKYSAYPTDTGLLIHVGENSATADKTGPSINNDDPDTQPVTLAWDDVPDATSYNVYWSKFPGIARRGGNNISSENNSATIEGLKNGSTYYFVVTTVKYSQESEESEELSFTVGQ